MKKREALELLKYHFNEAHYDTRGIRHLETAVRRGKRKRATR